MNHVSILSSPLAVELLKLCERLVNKAISQESPNSVQAFDVHRVAGARLFSIFVTELRHTMSTLSELKNAPPRNKHLAFGYVREFESHEDINCAVLIKYLCLAYINQNQDEISDISKDHSNEEEISKMVDLTSKGVRVDRKDNIGRLDEEVLLSNVVYEGINEWKWKINAIGGMDTIGIKTRPKNPSNQIDTSYGLILSTQGELWRKTQGDTPNDRMREKSFFKCEKLKVEVDDTITMRLNCNEWKLEYKINEKEFIHAFYECNIEESRYSARIGLLNCGGEVSDYELISFQHFY